MRVLILKTYTDLSTLRYNSFEFDTVKREDEKAEVSIYEKNLRLTLIDETATSSQCSPVNPYYSKKKINILH